MKYGNRRRVRQKVRHIAPLDGCAWMAAIARLKNKFTEDEKCHNLVSWLNYIVSLYIRFLAFIRPKHRNNKDKQNTLCLMIFLSEKDTNAQGQPPDNRSNKAYLPHLCLRCNRTVTSYESLCYVLNHSKRDSDIRK